MAHQQASGAGASRPILRAARTPRNREATRRPRPLGRTRLIAAGMADHPAVLRGVRYLAKTQNLDGTWDESQFTGTDSPASSISVTTTDPIYFPLMALAQWAILYITQGGFMRFPTFPTTSLTGYLISRKISGKKRSASAHARTLHSCNRPARLRANSRIYRPRFAIA